MTTARPRRRADAERNIAAILSAARELFGKGPLPSMNDIARAAGVGRVTLYAHFASREALLEAVIDSAIAETDAALTALDLDRLDPEEALRRLIETSWSILNTLRRTREAALADLDPEQLRRKHDPAFRHVERVLDRGRQAGVFRGDLPLDWLVASCYAVVHAAADEVNAGRIRAGDAPGVVAPTVLAMLAPTR
ncbi:TetR/AcrR family transcriptional regulator [Prauserella muralis]|uniref:Uncharacterized protein n=1 Tax=Prauserella muralis TaxID=588067 RepID=A0A2V4BBP1_9PSEU|nr:TetR/AcrR family transcriptional regulator [Prauserella muralis]PXY32576.1 hypothetical protein BAY60_10070 [Prauserella muralis]TWE23709.1 TetR family transcriptional regulator [Prauserella muralis]